jgi:arylsulfatase A-like enzyme
MGEKDLFHEPSVKVPLIICDPSAEADAARGTICDALVETIDLIPTFLDALGADLARHHHRLEGHSLMPFLRGDASGPWRRFVISEYDYSMSPAAPVLGVGPRDARLFMVYDGRWKYVHAVNFPPMLFDLASDPDEFRDLGRDPVHAGERDRLGALLAEWGLRLSQRTTLSDGQIKAKRGQSLRRGILIGVWQESDIPEELWSEYLGRSN